MCVLREESVPYNADFAPENEALSAEKEKLEGVRSPRPVAQICFHI
jgi:hypothetical protein